MVISPRRTKWLLSLYPPYLGAGIRVTHIADDWSHCRVEMPLRRYNRNIVGTHFGGSLYSMTDPHLMLLLMRRLGRQFVVWDQAASIRFVQPGRGRVHADFRVTDEEVASILEETASGEAARPVWSVDVRDANDEVVAVVEKTLYIRRKREA